MITGPDWGHWAVWRHVRKKRRVCVSSSISFRKMSPLWFQNTFPGFWNHRSRLATLSSLETFAEENKSLNTKLDCSWGNVAVEVSKYIPWVLRSQGQIVDISQFGHMCGRKKEFESQARLFLRKCRCCDFKIHFPVVGNTVAEWGHRAVWTHLRKKKRVRVSSSFFFM